MLSPADKIILFNKLTQFSLRESLAGSSKRCINPGRQPLDRSITHPPPRNEALARFWRNRWHWAFPGRYKESS